MKRDGEVTVKVNSYGPGRPLALVWFDPVSGRKKAESSGTTDWREAERLAGEREKELRAGTYAPPSRVTWAAFRERFNAEKLAGMPKSTQAAYGVALDHLERTVNPDRLAKLTADAMSRFAAKLRADGMKDNTIARHLRHIKAALRWAERMGLMVKAPKIDMPRRPKGQSMMKGRPITGEEFDRMLAAVPKVRPQDAPAWQRYLTGLWLSGLRLEESIVLSWDTTDAPFSIDLAGKRPAFRILAEAQKANRDEVLPMTPDFAQWLLESTPEAERVGRVFPLRDARTGKPIAPHRVGEVIGRIGKRAKVITDKRAGKYATCHDLRRSFGTRWAKREMPAVLQRLMRHAHIQTTMGYYVALSADEVADELWQKWGKEPAAGEVGNTFGNNGPESALPREPRDAT